MKVKRVERGKIDITDVVSNVREFKELQDNNYIAGIEVKKGRTFIVLYDILEIEDV